MLRLNITDNAPDVKRALRIYGRQGTFAAAVALTRTAQDVRAGERAQMEKDLDRPTPYTKNSLFLQRATKEDLTAKVWLKDDRAGSGTPATQYLLPQIMGGSRALKGFEVALRAQGLLPDGMQAVPGSGVKLDAYGNVSKGTINRILSQLRVQRTDGYESRATGSKRSNRTKRKQGVQYFVLLQPHGRLRPGIYARSLADQRRVTPVFVYVSGQRYGKRFRFFEAAERIIRERFAVHFRAELAKALRTAR
jgi:hypothetical protein